MNFFIARQAIFNREGKRVAYEVFLRKENVPQEYPKEVPFNKATSIVIETILEKGIGRIGEGKRVMINASMDFLINKAIESLESHRLIIDVIEPQIPIGEILHRQILNAIDKHTRNGVLFGINEKYLGNEKMASLFDKTHIILVDANRLTTKVLKMAKTAKKTLLISKIENDKHYIKAVEFGDLFQGIYLESPMPLGESKIAPYLKTTLLKLLKLVYNAQSPKELADVISTDVGMSAKILRFVNSAFYSPLKEIKSVEQACAVMGLKSLKNFILTMAMSDHLSMENPELWKKSLVRAIIAQKLAEIKDPKHESDAYLMGLFSLIDEILNVDKLSFLSDIKVGQEIIEGYIGKNAFLKSILDYSVEMEERSETLLGAENPEEDETLIKLEKLTGIDRQKLLYIIRSALDTLETMLKV